jgi:hypothetical protein
MDVCKKHHKSVRNCTLSKIHQAQLKVVLTCYCSLITLLQFITFAFSLLLLSLPFRFYFKLLPTLATLLSKNFRFVRLFHFVQIKTKKHINAERKCKSPSTQPNRLAMVNQTVFLPSQLSMMISSL